VFIFTCNIHLTDKTFAVSRDSAAAAVFTGGNNGLQSTRGIAYVIQAYNGHDTLYCDVTLL